MTDLKILLLDEVKTITRLSERSIFRHVDAGTFPKPFKIGNKNAWLESTINSWVFEQVEAAHAPEGTDE